MVQSPFDITGDLLLGDAERAEADAAAAQGPSSVIPWRLNGTVDVTPFKITLTCVVGAAAPRGMHVWLRRACTQVPHRAPWVGWVVPDQDVMAMQTLAASYHAAEKRSLYLHPEREPRQTAMGAPPPADQFHVRCDILASHSWTP